MKLSFLPIGYEIREKTDHMPLERAAALLRSRAGRRITKAVRHPDDTVTLTRHVWRCPFCSFELPAYHRHLKGMYHLSEPPAAVYDPTALDTWASTQESFFEKERIFCSNTPVLRPRGAASCPRCHRMVVDAQSYYIVEVTENKDVFSITVALTEEETKVVEKRNPYLIISPLIETLTFDLEKHAVSLKWSDSVKGCECSHWSQATVTKYLIENYHLLHRSLKRFLADRWNGRPLPFHNQELSVNTFALMTCYTGFRRGFYDALPFEDATYRMDSSWQDRLDKLTTVSGALSVLRESTLPAVTSIRYQFLVKNQGLLLYIPECEMIWSWVEGDVRCFHDLLRKVEVYEALLWMHCRKESIPFLEDFVRRHGYIQLYRMMTSLWYVKLYASCYGRWQEAEERVFDGKHFPWWKPVQVNVPYLMNYRNPPGDVVVDGYFFHKIGCQREMLAVDQTLLCDTDCVCTTPPIYVAYCNHVPVAVIRTDRFVVLSVTGQYGMPVEDPSFRTAFNRWCQRFSFEYIPLTQEN